MSRKYTETFEFDTMFGRHTATHEARITYTIDHPLPQSYGQPAEAARVGDDVKFEIWLSGLWHKASDDLHDILLDVLGDDLDWLIEAAEEQEQAMADDYADAMREERASLRTMQPLLKELAE